MICVKFTPERPVAKFVYVYRKPWMEPKLNPMQALRNNSNTAFKLLYYCVNRNDNTTYYNHDSIHKQRIIAKESSMDSFQSWLKHFSLFSHFCLFISRINLYTHKHYWCPYLYIAARTVRKLQAGYLLANDIRNTYFPIHFHTYVHVLIPLWCFMM